MKNRHRTLLAHSGWLRPLCLLVVLSILLSLAGPLGQYNVPKAQANPYPPYWDGGAGTAIHYAPAPWPSDSQWVAYTRGGSTINDPRTADPSNGGTRPQNYVNVSSGCTDQSLPSVYYYYNAISQTISYRFRIEQIANTYATGPSAGTFGSADPWNSGTWSVLIDINGDGYRDFALQLDGQTGTPSAQVDRVVSVYSTAKNQYVNYLTDSTIKELFHNPTAFVDSSTSKILNFHGTLSPDTSWPNGASETNWDYGTTRATNISTSCNEYFVDYQIPLAMLNATSVGGPAVTADTPMAFMFATANSNSNPLQKDVVFMGDFTSDPTKPAPFGDIVTLNGGRQSPAVTAVTAAGCGPASLAATVNAPITISGGNAATSITSANFYFYADANANGLADDGSSWTFAAVGSTSNSPLGYWTGSWVTSTQFVKGQYLIGVQATDGVSTTQSWLTNPPDGTGNPAADPGAVWATFSNSCGVTPPNASKTVTPSYVSTGATVTYTISISNPTGTAITVSRITDTLPAGFTLGTTTSGSLLPATTSPNLGDSGAVTWTFPNRSVSATSTSTLIFTATASSTTGSYLNRVQALSSYGSLDSGLTAQVDVGAPYLTIAKAVAVTTVAPGGNVTYTISYGNDSTIRATSVVISDVLPTGVSWVSGGSYDAASRTVTWSVGDLAPGDSGYSQQLIVQTGNPFTGTAPLANTATILSNDTSPASATAAINVSQPTLSVQKSANNSAILPGGTVVYTITYANISGNDVTGATLTDTIPSGMTYVSSSNGGISSTSGIVTWSIGSLSAGASGTRWITATASNPFTYTNPVINTANLKSNETSMVSDTYRLGVVSTTQTCIIDYFHNVSTSVGFDGSRRFANTTAPTGAGTSISTNLSATPAEIARWYSDPAFSSNTYLTGSITATIWLTVPNGSQTDVTVSIRDYDPTTGVSTTLGSASLTSLTGLTPAQSRVFTMTTTSPAIASGHRLLWAVVGSDSGNKTVGFAFDSTSFSDNSRVCTLPPPDLRVDKAANSLSISPPGTLSYTIRYGNDGGVTTTLAVLTDVLPSGMTFVTSTMNGSPVSPTILSSNVLSFTVNSTDRTAGTGIVTSGGQGFLVITGTIGALATGITTLTNTANISSAQTSLISSTATSAVVQPYLSLTKAASDNLLAAGNRVTYTLNLVNSGSGAASSVMVTDVLSETAYFTYVASSSSPAASWNSSTHTLSWTGLSLAAGSSTALTFAMDVAGSGLPSGTTVLTNTATATSSQTTDTITSNAVRVTISANPNLAIGKSIAPIGVLAAGQVVTYTLVVSNTGSAAASDTTIVDALPSYMSFVSGTITLQGASKTNADDSDSGGYDGANRQVKWTLGTLASNTSGITATFQALVDATMPNGTTALTNTATIAASNAASKQSSVYSQVTAQPSFSLTKSAPSVLGYPPTTLALDASAVTTVTVQSVTQLNVGDVVYINGTTATINNIEPSTNEVGLSASITASPGAGVYGTIKYVISYNNSGTAQATGVVITDVLQSGLTYVSSSPAAGVSGQTITWTVGTVNINVPGQVTVVARPTATGSYVDTASIGSVETLSTNSNTTNTTVGAPVLEKRTTSPLMSQTSIGASATYVISMTNPLGTSVAGVIVTDTLSTGFTFSSTVGVSGYTTYTGTPTPTVGSGIASWGVFAIPGSGTLLITYTTDISSSAGAATYQNDVDATSTSYSVVDFDPLVVSQEDVTLLVAAVSITKTTSSPIVINTDSGTVATYTVALRNTGNDAATGIRLTDTLPTGFTYLSTLSLVETDATRTETINPSLGSTTPSWGSWSFPASAGVVTITFSTAVASSVADGTYHNTASATALTTTIPIFDGSIQTADNVQITSPVLAVAKTGSPNTVTSGGLLTYTMYVTNTGTATATGALLTDTLPLSTTYASSSGSGAYDSGSREAYWSLGSVSAGTSLSRTLVVTTATGLHSGETIVNSNYKTDSIEKPPLSGSPVTITIVANPTGVTVTSLRARSVPAGIEVDWETGWEQSLSGFNVWRAGENTEDWRRLNPLPVSADGGSLGRRYAFVDGTPLLGRHYRYRLEVVNLFRASDWFGPVLGWRAYTIYMPFVGKQASQR